MSQLEAPMFKALMKQERKDLSVLAKTGYKCITFSQASADLVEDLLKQKKDVLHFLELAPLPMNLGFLDVSRIHYLPDLDTGRMMEYSFEIEPNRYFPDIPLGEPIVTCWSRLQGGPIGIQLVFYIDKQLKMPALSHEMLALMQDRGVTETGPPTKESVNLSLQGVSRIFVAACAVLAAPGVRSTSDNRKVRWAQQMRQPCPHMEYRCVDIDIDMFAAVPGVGGHGQGGGSPKALHHVRGHLRLTEKGLVPVRAHWRGNPAYGTKLRDFNIKRTEEMQ